MSDIEDPIFAPVLRAGTGDERAVLEAFLDLIRGVVLRKVAGLSDADAARRLVPSLTTVAGVVKHLILVEENWFVRVLDAKPGDMYVTPPEEGTESFTIRDADTVEALAEAYQRACARSREIAARYPLDHVVTHPHLGEITLRWILVHMVQETARHVGHTDILRELTDGSTGMV